MLEERAREGIHALLTAQRRMGKTNLVRELQSRLAETGDFEVVFVDLEATVDPADAISKIGVQTKYVRAAWDLIKTSIANLMRNASDQIESSPASDLLFPLKTALEQEIGLEPRVAREVEKIAKDIRRELLVGRMSKARRHLHPGSPSLAAPPQIFKCV